MVNQLLKQAAAATEQENWSLVNQYLQQLSLEKTNQFQQALDLALKVLEQGDFQERWNLAKIFPKFGDLAISPLIKILEDEELDLEQRWFAGKILGEFNHPEVIFTLAKLLKTTEDEELATISAKALANLGKSSIDLLTNLLSEPNYRGLATSALAQIRSREVIGPLLKVAQDQEPSIRSVAIEALSSFHDPSITPVLIEALNDYAAVVRKEAVIALGFRKDLATKLDLLNYLQPRLYDLNLEVSQQAAIALGRLGTEQAATALFDVVESSTTPIPLQITIIKALAWIETAVSIEYLQKSFPLVAEASILELVRVLGRIESEVLKLNAAQILLDFFDSGHPIVGTTPIKQALAHAWGQLGNNLAVEALRHLSKDNDNRVKLQAVASLKRIVL
ncbi:MAG: HEAT repeat domain-containing protein [Symploca sp. SIO3C6]|uniref:HEAT repeat domain-containing protein n=1 Tax=Symploca sp. SIO1C4 TaxID=2607765 RepID=A0A6B3NNF8_9CYAN|nr:HEAT repeat domain-containing protein [Symploca sp. SIO3C6]NER31764.1 HEAT repeat domain-containing protein [Symploca sp. SIO1C4]